MTVSYPHMEHEALRLTERRRNTKFQTIHSDDTRTASPDIGNTGKHYESILHIANTRDEGVGDEYQKHGDQADRATNALKQHERMSLAFIQKVRASLRDELERHLYRSCFSR